MLQQLYDVGYVSKGSYGCHAIVAAVSRRRARAHIANIAITGYTKAARKPRVFRIGFRTTTIHSGRAVR